MGTTTLEELQEELRHEANKRRAVAAWQRRLQRVQDAQGVDIADVKRKLGAVHLTLIGGLFTLLAAVVGGMFDVIAHLSTLHP